MTDISNFYWGTSKNITKSPENQIGIIHLISISSSSYVFYFNIATAKIALDRPIVKNIEPTKEEIEEYFKILGGDLKEEDLIYIAKEGLITLKTTDWITVQNKKDDY